MKHITTDKGDIGVAIVIANLLQSGYSVFTPISATCPFDLLVYHENKFKRIQVKYRHAKNNTITIEARRARISSSKNDHRPNTEFDVLAVYCPDTNSCYYVNREEFHECITLRLVKSKNNQENGIKNADDYLQLGPIAQR